MQRALSCLFYLFLVLYCLVLSCLVWSGLVLFCFLSCRVVACLVLSCRALSCLGLSWLVVSCLVLSCLVLSCLGLDLRLVLMSRTKVRILSSRLGLGFGQRVLGETLTEGRYLTTELLAFPPAMTRQGFE